MAKPAAPKRPTAWEWFCQWARQQGVDPELFPLTDATEHLLSTLEYKDARGAPLPPAMVQLAALLIAIQGELAIDGTEPTWGAAQPHIEHAFARQGVTLLNLRRDRAPLPSPKPEILAPETPPDTAFTLYDVVRTFREVLENVRTKRSRHTPA